ncbi:hypothetical protein GH714_025559 [Hevea brasiliensis]|uniref:Homeobox domain-containing protein n=1 Tax=Hevea brasiliensis TaxID=3981 RepID=A0A6A6MUS2_HEVBR|nr:hypothetical protein GH714_025559 [Hevea brasiliensis]
MEDDHEDEHCNTGLGLKLGMTHYVPKEQKRHNKDKSRVCLDLSFTLRPKDEEEEEEAISVRSGSSFKSVHHQDDEDHATNKGNDFISINKNSSRKKLRLTKEQSTLLEDSFKLHTALNPAQKHELAERLSLTARQVEVWFQNRRARTKLKQTEADCEFLKRCCESLSEENTRLKKELQKLRSLRLIERSPLCLHLPACPSWRNPLLLDVVLFTSNKSHSPLY